MRRNGYNPRQYYDANPDLQHVLDALSNGNFSPERKDLFVPMVEQLLSADYYMVLADFGAYIEAQKHVSNIYRDQPLWTKLSVLNTAGMGYFSSDRAIGQYAREIWKVKPCPIKLAKQGK